MQGSMVEEKRRFSRISYDAKARIIVNDKEFCVDRIINISVGGCQVALQQAIPLHTDCVFVVVLEGISEGVRVHGRVVRCSPGALSLKFTAVDPQNLFHLHNILRYNSDNPDRIEKEISKRPGLK